MFKHFLDKKSTYKLDKGNLYGSILALPEQIENLWEETKEIKVGRACKLVDNIVVAGMGGSALGARVIQGLEHDSLRLPLRIINGYHLPKYVDERSLVLLSSYSGGTEEILSCAKEAFEPTARCG